MRISKLAIEGVLIAFFSISPVLEAFPKGAEVFDQFEGLQCESYHSRKLQRELNFCLHRTRPDLPRLDGEPAIYFFHGINGGAQTWVENGYAEAVQILSREENFPPFTWISFDTEKMSFFSDFKGRRDGTQAYETWLLEEFMPYLEARYKLCSRRECRMTAGVSMGGLGALKTALRHPTKFVAGAANSAALSPFNAHEPFDLWNQYFSRHPVGPVRGQLLLAQVKNIFPTRETFEAHDSALLVERLKGSEFFPQLYFDVGGRDYFGFQEGFFRLRDTLLKNEIPHFAEYFPEGSHELFWERRWWLIRWIRDQVLKNSTQASIP